MDWFVGRQIGVCHNLELSDKSSVMVTLQHSGSNAGLLDWVKLHSWDVNKEWTCYIPKITRESGATDGNPIGDRCRGKDQYFLNMRSKTCFESSRL